MPRILSNIGEGACLYGARNIIFQRSRHSCVNEGHEDRKSGNILTVTLEGEGERRQRSKSATFYWLPGGFRHQCLKPGKHRDKDRARPRRCGQIHEDKSSYIYAIGDCASPFMLAHVAMAEGEVAAENIAGNVRAMDYGGSVVHLYRA